MKARTSWRTTAAALVSALSSFILWSSLQGLIRWPAWAQAIAMFTQAGGLAGLGLAAKDAGVHSTEGEVRVATAEATEKAKTTT